MCRRLGSRALAALGIVSALLAAQPAAAKSGKAIEVDCGAGATIAAALASIGREGGTVLVSGVCHENVVLDRDGVTLQSEPAGAAGIVGPAADTPAVLVTGRHVVVSGFGTITGGPNGDGIRVAGGGSAEIIGNTVANNGRHGISVIESSFAAVEGNEVSGSVQNGIVVVGGAYARIHGNTSNNNGYYGILVFQAASADIDGNTANGNGYAGPFPRDGITVAFSSSARLSVATTEPNRMSGNARFGLLCASNSSIQVGASQLIGTNGTEPAFAENWPVGCAASPYPIPYASPDS
jgi:parallel beta-helix repeat protein